MPLDMDYRITKVDIFVIMLSTTSLGYLFFLLDFSLSLSFRICLVVSHFHAITLIVLVYVRNKCNEIKYGISSCYTLS
jgi:hypothetical protein